MFLDWIAGVFNLSAISLVITSATLLIINYYLKARHLPHGPTGLPFVGYWTFLKEKDTHLQFDNLQKKYRDIYSFTAVGRLFVNLGSYKVLQEAYIAQTAHFERFQGFSLLNAMFTSGIGFMNGEGWKIMRRFFHQSVKQRSALAMKESLSGSLYESVNSTIDDLKKMSAEPVDVYQLLMKKCNTIFRQTLFGEHISDERMWEICELFLEVTPFFSPKNMVLTGNISRYIIFPFRPGYSDFKDHAIRIENLMYDIINEHKSTYDEGHLRNVIDDYIKERNIRQSKKDRTAHYFTDEILMSSLNEIIGGGVFTTGDNIVNGLKMLLHHPEEQDKIYKEIIDVIGLDRQPTLEDKKQLTYTNAFLMEVLRTSDIFPFFPNMECKKETTVNGFKIPKGAITILNKWSAHRDPKVFEEPMKFNPSRYINANGEKKLETPLTFGIGKRVCMGENFSMRHFFLFITTIIQNFHLSLADTTLEQLDELFWSAKFKIRVQPRIHSK